MGSVLGIGKREIQLKKDSELKKTLKELRKQSAKIKALDIVLYKQLDVPRNKIKALLAKGINAITPAKIYEIFPMLGEFVAEQNDISEYMETQLRVSVNNTQEIALDLKRSAQEESEKLGVFVEDIKKMEEEKWNSQKIHEYLTETVNEYLSKPIEDDGEIMELLDARSGILSAEVREDKRVQLLSRLKINAENRKVLIGGVYARLCDFTLEVLEKVKIQLFDYATVIRPVRMITKVAEELTDVNKAVYASKDVIFEKIRSATEALSFIADAMEKVDAYAVSSKDTTELFQQTQKMLEAKMAKLEISRKKILESEEKRDNVLKMKLVPEKKGDVEDAEFKEMGE